MIDAVVVGSGPSGVQAAWRLVEAGWRVVVVDGGDTGAAHEGLVPANPFRELRDTDEEQHRYFLGDDFEGIPLGGVRVGAQLTPPRQFMAAGGTVAGASAFTVMRSLATGGLGAGWGAAAFEFTDSELRGWPVRRADLAPHYAAVAARVGVAGALDDAAEYFPTSGPLLPSPPQDDNAREIMRAYSRRREDLRRAGFHLGAARLAVATVAHRGRGPLACRDMDFYADHERAFHRPQHALEALKWHRNIEHRPGLLALRFEELPGGGVRLHARDRRDGGAVALRARWLVLAAGTFGTTEIVLRSIGQPGDRVPLVSNPYTYFPCLLWRRLGAVGANRRHSMTQLAAAYDPDGSGSRVATAQFYSYRSLLNFKLVKEVPLPRREAMRVIQLLQESLVIVGVHHEDRPGPSKQVWLDEAAGTIGVRYARTAREEERRHRVERRLAAHLRSLGLLPLRRIDPGAGASIHYGGTLPMASGGRPLTTAPDGILRGTTSVLIADGAALPHLPAKGLTLTLMANADRVAAGLLGRA